MELRLGAASPGMTDPRIRGEPPGEPIVAAIDAWIAMQVIEITRPVFTNKQMISDPPLSLGKHLRSGSGQLGCPSIAPKAVVF